MATSSLKKSFVISSKTEASKLVKMFSDSITKKQTPPEQINITTVSTEQLKEIVASGIRK